MLRGLVFAALLVAAVAFSVSAETLDKERIRSDFENMARELAYLDTSAVLYDRTHHPYRVADPNKQETHFRILRELADAAYPKEALLDLLTHDDPKVRTLAAVALFDREDPSILPALVSLCADEAATFDSYPELSDMWLRTTGIGPPPLKQTVGGIANSMVNFYMSRSSYFYGIKHPSEPGFAEYWNERKNRSYCAGWFSVQFDRARQGQSPPDKNRNDRITAVRKKIDELPEEERAWVLLWLNGEFVRDEHLVTEKELVALLQKVGPDKLLMMLEYKIPSDDPDLEPHTSSYSGMILFVLKHADQLLRRSDSNRLLENIRLFNDLGTPWLAIAAARLNPGRASQILHSAIDRFQKEFAYIEYARAELCAAMWQLCGSAETEFIVNWFFEENPDCNSFSNSRSYFIVAVRDYPNAKAIIARIIQDPRMNSIDGDSVVRLVRLVNEWSREPVITEDELDASEHIYYTACFWLKEENKFPKEVASLRALLGKWQNRLSLSITDWLDNNRE